MGPYHAAFALVHRHTNRADQFVTKAILLCVEACPTTKHWWTLCIVRHTLTRSLYYRLCFERLNDHYTIVLSHTDTHFHCTTEYAFYDTFNHCSLSIYFAPETTYYHHHQQQQSTSQYHYATCQSSSKTSSPPSTT